MPLLSSERALVWPKIVCGISKNYHGDALEGNACTKLLKHRDKHKLLEHEICGQVGSLNYVCLRPWINSSILVFLEK